MAMTVESAKQAVAEKYGKSSWDLLMRYGWFEHTADEEEREKERILDEVHEMVDDELARLAAELEKHRWIQVEERLPEMGQGVLVFMKSGLTTIGYLKDGNATRLAWQLFGDLENIVELSKDSVTHWRYLPELP